MYVPVYCIWDRVYVIYVWDRAYVYVMVRIVGCRRLGELDDLVSKIRWLDENWRI